MQKINYSLIVSDFDGTLVNKDKTISQINKDAIAQYKKDGGKFAISTGRLPAGIINRAKELGLQGAVSCCQGSVIVDIESKEILLKGAIPNKTAVKICRKMEELQLHIHVYDVWTYYSNMDDAPLKWYESATETKAEIVSDKPLSEFLEEKGFDVCKLLVMVDSKDNERIRCALENENFENCQITKSADVLLEVVNAEFSKGTAVRFLAEYYGVAIEKTVGVGDQWNDIPMIEAAGLGVAVKNADNALKEKADIVLAYTNEEGAVSKLIEEYGYTEE